MIYTNIQAIQAYTYTLIHTQIHTHRHTHTHTHTQTHTHTHIQNLFNGLDENFNIEIIQAFLK